MGTTDLGNQTITYAYQHDATSEEVNKKFSKVIKTGIYEGASLSVASNVISITAFEAIARTSTGQLIKIVTSTTITSDVDAAVPNIPLTAANPYIIGNFTWANQTTSYMDFEAKSLANIASNDIVFGKAIFSGADITGFDLTRRTYGLIDQENNIYGNSIALTTLNTPVSGIVGSGLVITGEIDGTGIISYFNGELIHILYT